MPLHMIQRLKYYVAPWLPLQVAIRALISTLLHHTSIQTNIRDEAFVEWYVRLGHHMAAYEDTTSVASLVPQASGIVLEIGPGSGNQLQRFDKTKISKIYGVESNASFLPMLQGKVEECGLEEVYVPVMCGIEDSEILKAHGIVGGSVDSIVSMQALCSVQDPGLVIKQIDRLLKPGGKLYFWEHQRSQDFVTSWMQRLWNFAWTPLIGGCRLDRETEKKLFSGVEWDIEEFEKDDTRQQPWLMLPRVSGVLVKK